MSERKRLTVSASPHIKSSETASGMMLDVIIALIPALIASAFIFGARTIAVTALSVASCVLAEYICRKVMKREQTVGDLSAVVTGILLAYNLPSTIPYWIIVVGAVIAIVIVKQMFGGIGQNFVNPALAARIILMSSFPAKMSGAAFVNPSMENVTMTSASPLAIIAQNNYDALPTLKEMFLGLTRGCIGEVCAVALIVGGIYLVIRKVISPVIPLVYVGTVAVFMLIAFKGDFNMVAYQILGGGLVLGAIYMATDYTTSPITFKGKIVFAIGCGLITSVIRLFGSLPEGVSFSIILMNIFVPYIENLTAPKPFGTIEERLGKENEKNKEVAKS